jgi:hypothetical protein
VWLSTLAGVLADPGYAKIFTDEVWIMETYTRATDTGTVEHRHYDPHVVTNIFGIGEVIEWVKSVWGDEQDRTHATFTAGTVVDITPCYVIMKKYGSDKLVKMSKSLLANRVSDYDFGKIIEESIADDPDNIPYIPTTGESRSRKPKDAQVPFVVYTLSDPRDNAVRYVGISKNIDRRIKEHLACVGLNFKKNIWIQDLLINKMKPDFTIIERDILGLNPAKERERYWIRYHLNNNAQLTNIAEVDEVEGE